MSNYNDAKLIMTRLRILEMCLESGDIENAKKVISRMRDSIINQALRDVNVISKIFVDEKERKES